MTLRRFSTSSRIALTSFSSSSSGTTPRVGLALNFLSPQKANKTLPCSRNITTLLRSPCRRTPYSKAIPLRMNLNHHSPVWRCTTFRSLQSLIDRAMADSTSKPGEGQFVRIVEVGPRDGLQNCKGIDISMETKVELIERLHRSGLRSIEAGSMVRADRVPQMANTSEVLTSLAPFDSDTHYPVLIPNMRGLDNLLKLEERSRSEGRKSRLTDEIAVFVSATDAFSKANNGATVSEVLSSLPNVIRKAKSNGYRVRGYVSCIMNDPYSGETSPSEVISVAKQLLDMGCYEISLGDTTGQGDPHRWKVLWQDMEKSGIDMSQIAAHCHDTFATALSVITTLLPLGLKVIDASVSGLGGCPYSPGATGNLATEDLVYTLHQLGYETGVNMDKLVETGAWISEQLGMKSGSRAGTALWARRMAQMEKSSSQTQSQASILTPSQASVA